jgi:ABC-type multidrug transport system fused ATPase/permease subunit
MVIGSYVKSASELQIFVDGFPLRELDIGWLREKVGFVGQVRLHN